MWGMSIYGKLEEVPIDDMRRLFETNFWGVIYGSLEAAKQLKRPGGAIINLSMELAGAAEPKKHIDIPTRS